MLNHLVDGSDDGDLGEEIRYKLWVTTDSCTLQEMIANQDDCITRLSSAIVKLTRHHFEAKAQSAYFKQLKESVGDGEVVVQGFPQTSRLWCRMPPKGFHWDTKQSIVHPFLVYRRENGEQRHQSF